MGLFLRFTDRRMETKKREVVVTIITGGNLYHIQDGDRPMWVVADNYGHAVQKWKEHVAPENKMPLADVEEPAGVSFVCEANDFIPT